MNQNTKRNLLVEKKLLADEVAIQYNQIQVNRYIQPLYTFPSVTIDSNKQHDTDISGLVMNERPST